MTAKTGGTVRIRGDVIEVEDGAMVEATRGETTGEESGAVAAAMGGEVMAKAMAGIGVE
jgi:hypothetical protein